MTDHINFRHLSNGVKITYQKKEEFSKKSKVQLRDNLNVASRVYLGGNTGSTKIQSMIDR